MDGATTVIDIVAQVTDNTASGASSAEKNVSKLEKSMKKLAEQIQGMKGKSKLEVKATLKDMASKGIQTVISAGKKIAGKIWNVTVKATDLATAPLRKIWDLARNPITQMVAITGVSVGAADTLNTYKSFEQGMANVKAISGASEPEFQELTEQAKQLGETTQFSASEAASAMENLAMAGWKTESIISGMPGLLDLAAAGSVDLATASDVVASSLAQFKYGADESTRVADVLAATASNSKTDVQGLGESFKYAGSLAGALGYDIEDVALAFGLMGNSAIDASSAGTALRGMLSRMAKQGELTEEESNAVSTAMKKVGVSMTTEQGKAKSLMTVMKELRTGFSKLSEAEKTEVAANLAGQNAMSGLLAIVNASDEDFDKLTKAINESQGAAEEMANTKMDTLQGSILYMQSAVEGVQIAIGEKVGPLFRGMIDSVTAAMPAVQNAAESVLEWIGGKVDHFKTLFTNLFNSEEWAEATTGEKMNMLWDTMIAQPFLDWWDASGKRTIFNAIGSIFSEAGKILPGGEEATLTSWLSAGLIVKAAEPIVSTVGKIVTELDKISPAAGKWGLAAAAIAIAVGAIATAIETYNQQTISDNLEEHFGNLALSAKEAKEMAETILSAPWTVNMELALGEIRNAEQVRTDAEDQLKTMEKLTWKSNLGIKLNEAEAEEFMTASETFINDKKTELESKTYEVYLNTSLFLGNTKEGEDLSTKIATWAAEDIGEMDSLSKEISDKVGKAIEDGIIDADEQAAISALQEKMDNIISGWYDAQSKAKLELINQKYGNMGVQELTEGGYRELMTALRDYNETQEAGLDETYTSYVGSLYSMLGSGKITQDEFDSYKGIADRNYLNQRASNRAQSMQVGTDTLNNAYSEKLGQNAQKMDEAMEEEISGIQYRLGQGQNGLLALELDDMAQSLNMGNGKNIIGKVKDADQAGLNSLLDSLAPDASALASLMDQYAESGQAVPQAFKDSYYDAMELMASAGDSDAALQTFAHRLTESGDQAMIDAINKMANEGGLSEEFTQAWKRAMLGTTDEDLEIDSPEFQLSGNPEIMNKDEWTAKLHEIEQNLAEGDIGSVTAETEADITVTVNKGDCLSQIGEAVGVDWQEIAKYNGIEDPYIIYPDMEIKIPKEGISMDTSELEASITESAGGEDGGTVTVTAKGDVEVHANTVDSETAYEETQTQTQETYNTPMETDGSTDITLSQSNNASEIYGETANEVRSAYSTPIPATATVNVTLNWNLLNPTKSISVTGSGSGSGSLQAQFNAEGSFVDRPILSVVGEDGPEFIIPVGSNHRNRGLSLWEQAGEALGVVPFADGGAAGYDDIQPIFDTDGSGDSQQAAGGASPVTIENISFEINVDGAEAQNPQDLVDAIRQNIEGMTDDIAYILATSLKQAYTNTPKQSWGA